VNNDKYEGMGMEVLGFFYSHLPKPNSDMPETNK
jgi:hypothetical protein